MAFTGITLALGVSTWAFSSLKFQADMGLLLVLLFVWNMVGALVLMPALVSVLGVRHSLDSTQSQSFCRGKNT